MRKRKKWGKIEEKEKVIRVKERKKIKDKMRFVEREKKKKIRR